jgi:hypothetical protein
MKKFLLLTLVVCVLFANAANTGFLGTTITDFNSEKINGALVTDVIDNSVAKKYGIKENDIITAVNDVAVSTKEALISTLGAFNLGDKIKISFVRNGITNVSEIVLGKKPEAIKFKMRKTIQQDGEHWFFANDNTEIVVTNDNKPVSITQTDINGKATTLKFATTSFNNIAQQFTDVDDKLISIVKNKKQQESCSCKCPVTDFTYYKITPETEAKSITATDLTVDKFTIAPNPTDGKFVIDFATKQTGTLQFSILDITGRTVKSERVPNFDGFYNKQINLDNEAKGAYFIQFRIGDKMSTKKIVLQ